MNLFNTKIHTSLWNTTWFVAFSVIVTCIIVYLLIRTIIRKSLRDQALKQRLLHAQLTALRTQMNPHFIFNSLNSIQGLIIRSDVIGATQFIAKFSKLIRNVLENSDKQLITVRDEIENLQLYFSIEEIRFDHKFNYSLSCAVELHHFEIPSLVVQPLVENVIWENLKNGGLTKIDVIFSKEKEKIICKIIYDDKANRNDGLNLPEKAIALKLTASRLSMLNHKSTIEEANIPAEGSDIIERILKITFDLSNNNLSLINEKVGFINRIKISKKSK